MTTWHQEGRDETNIFAPESRSNGFQSFFGDIPRSSLSSFTPLKEKDKNSEVHTQFSTRSSGPDQRIIRKPPLNPRPADYQSAASPNVADNLLVRNPSPQMNGFNGPVPFKGTPSLTTRSSSPKHSPAVSPVAGMAWSSMLDPQASRRVGPLPNESAPRNSVWTLEKSIRRTVNLRDSELFFISKKIVLCVRHNSVPADKESQRLATTSTATFWGPIAEFRTDPASLQALSSAGQEVADYMSTEFAGRYSVILSTPELAQILWDGPIHLVQESPFEAAPLQESVMLLLHLERYLNASPDHVVLFFQGNISVVCALIGLQDSVAYNCDSRALLVDLCALRKETVPPAGTQRYLAMLDSCMNSPELIEASPKMLVASLRLFGDHEFVRSSETLIRVHAEVHHSGVIDSTDYREQMCYRITRGSEAEACLVISFVPIKLTRDVRLIIFSTLASESGLISGPKPMLQVSFHTAFVDTTQPVVFLAEDIDPLQGFCPIRRVVLSPGNRYDDELLAPEVKFVRKKVKKNNPLELIADLLTAQSPRDGERGEDEERSLQDCRPVEVRVPGKVFRDDSRASSRPSSAPAR